MSGRSPPLYDILILIVMQVHQTKTKTRQKQCSTSSNLVVIIYCFIGCSDQASTWYLAGFLDGSNLGSTVYCRGEARRYTVFVCVFSSHSFWTSSSLDVPAGVTQEEGHTGFLIHLPSAVRALIFVARRIQPFLSLVDREVEFCVLTN